MCGKILEKNSRQYKVTTFQVEYTIALESNRSLNGETVALTFVHDQVSPGQKICAKGQMDSANHMGQRPQDPDFQIETDGAGDYVLPQ